MEDLVSVVRERLRVVFTGRPVIVAGGFGAGAVQPTDQLRELGAGPFLVLSSGAGTGAQPDGPDVEMHAPFVEEHATDDHIVSFRREERIIARPPQAVLDIVRRFDPGGDAVVVVPAFLDVRALGDRHAFGARRAEWVALEDKTTVDEMFDEVGVPRPASRVVAADASSLAGAVAVLDRGGGTVWAADAREGFNGGGEYVRWVQDDADRSEAVARLLPRCDRIRVAEFVEGVPCSIHGFVVDDGVAVFRPVELVTLRAGGAPRLRYCGCATFFDPSAEQVATMRDSVRKVGEHLRARVGFRGAFTLDGIAARDGWVATECNPRFGAGLGYAADVLPQLCLSLLHYAVAEGALDVPSVELEQLVVAAAAGTRWGGAWTGCNRGFDTTSTWRIAGDASGYRFADESEPADAMLEAGPARVGGFVRIRFDPARTPPGPSIAPRAVAAFAFADEALGLGIGPLSAPVPA